MGRHLSVHEGADRMARPLLGLMPAQTLETFESYEALSKALIDDMTLWGRDPFEIVAALEEERLGIDPLDHDD